jgi:hypothetical protein
MMIKMLLATVLFATLAGKIIARSRFVIGPAHAVIEIPHFFGRSGDEILVSSKERRKYAHALLQDRSEIMSQVSWSSSSA